MNNRYAILVIDMLNDFINGKLRLDGVEDIVQNIQKLLTLRGNVTFLSYTAMTHTT